MRTIPLTQGKKAFVDVKDYELVSRHKWCAVKKGRNWYAMTRIPGDNSKQKTLYMHQLLLDIPVGKMGDHRDRNGLNNCRYNLRICTRGQNITNQRKRKGRKFKGVYPQTYGKRFYAVIIHEKVYHYLGTFDLEEEAAQAYDHAALLYKKEFATLNFPEGGTIQ